MVARGIGDGYDIFANRGINVDTAYLLLDLHQFFGSHTLSAK